MFKLSYLITAVLKSSLLSIINKEILCVVMRSDMREFIQQLQGLMTFQIHSVPSFNIFVVVVFFLGGENGNGESMSDLLMS